MPEEPDRLLTTGATVLEGPGNKIIAGANDAVNNRSSSIGVARGLGFFLCIMQSKWSTWCILLYATLWKSKLSESDSTWSASKLESSVQADLCRKDGAERLRKGKCYPSSPLCHHTHEINGDNQVQLQSRLQYWQVLMWETWITMFICMWSM